MTLLAVPYDWRANPLANTQLLDAFVAHPSWFSAPTTPEETRIAAAAAITNPQNLVWGVWNGGNLVGLLSLSGISPQVTARFHFIFFDGNLVGRRKFIWQFLGTAFREALAPGQPPATKGFQRLSFECPEHVPLVKFARTALHFKYEGEGRVVNHPAIDQSVKHRKLEKPDVWVARQGSRREKAHWHAGEWKDVMLLRLLRSEYEALTQEEPCPKPSLSSPPLVVP